MHRIYQTPAQQLSSSHSSAHPSKINQSQCQSEDHKMSPQELLDSIEEQIRDIEHKLIKVKQQKENGDISHSQYGQLEEERKQLKKELIDLDYQHQRCYAMIKDGGNQELSMNQSRKEEPQTAAKIQKSAYLSQVQEIEQKIQADYLDYSRKVQDQLQKIEKASKAREQQLKNLFSSDLNKSEKKESSSPYQQVPIALSKKTEAEIEEDLLRAQERSRKAQLQLALASDALSRSRQRELQAEINAIQTASDLSYATSYLAPSPLYLDPLDPLSVRLDPYLYPGLSYY